MPRRCSAVPWVVAVARAPLVLALFGCATGRVDASAPVEADPSAALASLRADDGPARFAEVTPSLYRGAAPTTTHLRALRSLGVTTIVDLRRETPGKRWAEQAAAEELGMRYLAYPFFGVFGAESGFLDDLVASLADDAQGAVYVHCDEGRERTSLAVALYRVIAQGWAPDEAWAAEVEAFDARRTGIFREIELTFRDQVHAHEQRRETARAGSAARRRLAGAGGGRGDAGAVVVP